MQYEIATQSIAICRLQPMQPISITKTSFIFCPNLIYAKASQLATILITIHRLCNKELMSTAMGDKPRIKDRILF